MVPPSSLRVPRARRYSGSGSPGLCFVYRILTFSDAASHLLRLHITVLISVLNPENISTLGLASSNFARHYFRNLVWFLFLRLLRCFSSAGYLHKPMDSAYDSRFFTVRVSPFGNLRVKAYFQLTAAYRRLSRPSSALDAKAFTLCSFSLEQFRAHSLQNQLCPSCLSFANNCLGRFVWKDLLFLLNVSCSAGILSNTLRLNCSFPLFGKTFN